MAENFEKISPFHWRLSKKNHRAMKADAEIFASEDILGQALADASIEQVINVACLPGLAGNSLAMPDIHYGYGFCIGAVAAFPAEDGLVLPGGVGYDINCGVRLISSSIPLGEFRPEAEKIGHAVLQHVPSGLTPRSNHRFDKKEFLKILRHGAGEIVRNFSGHDTDLERIESSGCLPFDDPGAVSSKAYERGDSQVGSLGSGNHFIEVQAVEEIYDEQAARAFGLREGMVAIMIHSGSRGFGHQIASDAIELFRKKNLGRFKLPDPQLVHAEIQSNEGKRYLQALNAASNFAWANRQLLMEDVLAIFERIFASGRAGLGLDLVYDQAHNIAKFEDHMLDGQMTRLLVHRKGATRALPPGHADIPAVYRDIGQPVIIPGSMGSHSYVLRGTEEGATMTFASSAHGAGRRLSRHQAIKFSAGTDVREKLKNNGILVFSLSDRALQEEIPEAYKDVDDVVEATVASGISRKVARLRPLVVIKG
jgi:tRNA-splicing ligase RtcB